MKKIGFKTIIVVFCIILIMGVLSGCGGAPMVKPERLADVPTYDVTGNCELELTGDVITVSGQTDLMDGVIVHISVHDQAGKELDSVNIIKNGDKMSQEFQVTASKYDETTKYVVGYITCVPKLYGEQSESVFKNYGEKFEYVNTKDDLWNNEGILVVFGSEMIEF